MVEMNSALDEVKVAWLTSDDYVIRKYVFGTVKTQSPDVGDYACCQ